MQLKRLCKQCSKNILQLPNVVGVGQGMKRIGGKATDERAIVVLVSKKVPADALKKEEIVPRSLSKVPVDVIEVGDIRLLSRTGFMRPAPPGVSIGHYKVTAGTFGAVVRDMETGEPLILSNNHILANSSNGKDARASIGDPIYQPGVYDGGGPDQLIGHLHRFVPVQKGIEQVTCSRAKWVENVINGMLRLIRPAYSFGLYKQLSINNLVDAAVAKPVSSRFITPEILQVGKVRGVREALTGMQVLKSGRSSGVNKGRVLATGAVVQVTLEDGRPGVFSDQIVMDPLAKPGDSGSLILDEENYAVGLLFAGSEQSTIGNRIKNVLDLLRVEI